MSEPDRFTCKLTIGLLEGLLKISCANNFRIDADGKCHNERCMMNQDVEIKKDIKEKGCIIFQSEINGGTPLQYKKFFIDEE